MKASNVLQNKRAFEIRKDAALVLEMLFNRHPDFPHVQCHYCESHLVARRKDFYECKQCGSYLGKAQS